MGIDWRASSSCLSTADRFVLAMLGQRPKLAVAARRNACLLSVMYHERRIYAVSAHSPFSLERDHDRSSRFWRF